MAVFGLFAFYGPSLTFLGQLRIVEVILLGLLFAKFLVAVRVPNRLEWWLLSLTIFTAIVFAGVGWWLESPQSAIILRAGSYLVMAAMLLSMMQLSHFKPNYLIAIILGYCASYVTCWFFFSQYLPNGDTYALVPWRLGLGFAATWAILCLIVVFPRLYPMVLPLMLVATVIHVVLGARSLGLATLACGILSAFAARASTDRVGPFRLSKVIFVCILALAFAWAALEVAVIAAEAGLLPEEMTTRMLRQYYSENGILLSARAPNYVAAVGIIERPILGFGPGNSDAELSTLYAQLSAENNSDGLNTDAFLDTYLEEELGTVIPSHSHVLGAWIEAGIVGGLYWMFIMAIVVYVMVRSLKFKNPWVPMYLFLSMTTLLDIVFSPGPHRVDIALRIVVFLFAIRQFQIYDSYAAANRSGAQRGSIHYGRGPTSFRT